MATRGGGGKGIRRFEGCAITRRHRRTGLRGGAKREPVRAPLHLGGKNPFPPPKGRTKTAQAGGEKKGLVGRRNTIGSGTRGGCWRGGGGGGERIRVVKAGRGGRAENRGGRGEAAGVGGLADPQSGGGWGGTGEKGGRKGPEKHRACTAASAWTSSSWPPQTSRAEFFPPGTRVVGGREGGGNPPAILNPVDSTVVFRLKEYLWGTF